MIDANEPDDVVDMIDEQAHWRPHLLYLVLVFAIEYVLDLIESLTGFFERIYFITMGFSKMLLLPVIGAVQESLIEINVYPAAVLSNGFDLLILQVAEHRAEGIHAAVGYNHRLSAGMDGIAE